MQPRSAHTSVILLATLILFIHGAVSAVMHSHSTNLHKERESDGAFSPRGKDHYSDSGEHNDEFDHEAILGSVKEAEEFDNLPPDEAKRRLRLLLIQMDLNRDKFIDRNELKAWILRSFKKLSEEEGMEKLDEIDQNQDGKVTWLEYIADAYDLHDGSGLIHDQDSRTVQYFNNDKELWTVADLNGNDVLEQEEWIVFSNPEEHPSMLPLILSQTLRDKDVDADGAINFQEFVGSRGKDQSKEWLISEKDKFDREHDKNGDGLLTDNEILSWIVPSNEEIAEEEMLHLFARCDDDHDDLLSFDEVIEHYDSFVGSEATDYGDHLHNIHHFVDEL